MISPDARIFVATASLDFRGSFDRLAGAVRAQLESDPRSGAFFVFFNRTGDRLKIYFFDNTGDCILYKRLDRGTFRGVLELDGTRAHHQIDVAALRRLLVGIAKPKKPRIH